MKHFWFGKEVIHILSALAIFVLTMGFGIKAIVKMGAIKKLAHSIAGVIILILCLFVTFVGLAVIILRMKSNYDWNTRSYLWKRKIHQIFGYLALLIGQVTVLLGLLKKNQGKFAWLFGINAPVIVIILVILELYYWKRWYELDAFKPVAARMSTDQFYASIKSGSKFVILDDMVINVADFIGHHPGGRFVLTHNIGRDISKFFYGGYCLEGNTGPNPSSGYTHSNYARMVVNKLIVAQLERDPETILCKVNQKRS